MTEIVLAGVAVEVEEGICAVCEAYVTRGVDNRWVDDRGYIAAVSPGTIRLHGHSPAAQT